MILYKLLHILWLLGVQGKSTGASERKKYQTAFEIWLRDEK